MGSGEKECGCEAQGGLDVRGGEHVSHETLSSDGGRGALGVGVGGVVVHGEEDVVDSEDDRDERDDRGDLERGEKQNMKVSNEARQRTPGSRETSDSPSERASTE